MPTYEYKCDACDYEFEEFQSITASSLRKCPTCGRPKLRRLIGIGAGVIFKGSGFYQTDYRSESYKKDADADKSKAKAETSGGETKTKDASKDKTKDATKDKGKDKDKDKGKDKGGGSDG